MKKLALTLGTALGAALIVLGITPTATAYPEQTCSVSVDRQVVQPQEKFTATGKASGVDAQGKPLPSSAFRWTFEWNGTTKHGTGATVRVSFRAPKDAGHPQTITLTARSTSSAGDCERHVDITVTSSSVSAPGNGGQGQAGHGHSGHQAVAGPSHGSILPSTGGPAFWMLVAGLVLLVGGGGAVAVSRRRHG